MPWISLAFLMLLGTAGARDAEGWEWRQTLTPHFVIKHQPSWLPSGFTMGAERVHFRLRMDLGMFSPWMSKEKINLFIYASQEAFLAGEFAPPKWSNGLAIYDRKAVALPLMKDPRELLSVMAHETTHLLFDSYWREAHRAPPSWLNEGLAMLEEAESPDKPETSVWYQKLATVDPKSFPSLDAFFAVTPAKDLKDSPTAAEDWYLQAYAVTHFLLRKHSRLQFKSLCAALRDGRTVEDALWRAYRYKRVADLDKKWRAWLSDPSHRRRVALMADGARKGDGSASGRAALRPISFRNFSTGKPGTNPP